jgi:hypothetical protein
MFRYSDGSTKFHSKCLFYLLIYRLPRHFEFFDRLMKGGNESIPTEHLGGRKTTIIL